MHFLCLQFLNRSMWKNFFPAVIPKNTEMDFLTRIFVFYGIDLYCASAISFPQ